MDQEKELVLALRAQMLEPQNCLEQVQRLFFAGAGWFEP
jgi:hypothetical protein